MKILTVIVIVILSALYSETKYIETNGLINVEMQDTIKKTLIVDTVYLYNPQTFERSIKLVHNYYSEGALECRAKTGKSENYIVVRDTVAVFNPSNYTERITVTTLELRCEEFIEWMRKKQ